ncbi:MAG: ATP-binding protein [Planctomycetota bacterium]|nr:ATP-binding protein [Planctomycetota bacterium]
MTTAKRVGLASVVLISLGASAAYYATTMALRGYQVHTRTLGYLVLGLIAALTCLILVVFWRNVHRTVSSIADQLEQMADKRRIGLLMVNGSDELAQITGPLNHLLAVIRDEFGRLRSEKRELQIQSRIAGAEKQHTEAIVFSISDAVIVTNRFDEIILANASAEKLMGFSLKHSMRKNIDHVIHDGTLVRLIRETRSGGYSEASTTEHDDRKPCFTRKVVEHTIDQKGQPRTFNATLSCVMTPEGKVSGVVAVLHDVTREREISQMKTDFVSSVSHELRTPLSSIKAYVEMLLDGEAGDEKTQREFHEIIAGETDRLNRLIENILNISRIESGVVRVVRESMSLTEVSRQALDVVAPQAKVKNITLVERLAPICYQVEADRDMIYQVVLNLTGNAIKYTPAGGTVTVSTSIDEHRGMAVCEVADTGVGIDSEDLPRIFEKFYRAEGHTKMAKGTGLGLTLVKHIIESVHNGKLSVTSEIGVGSTFSFELPILQ